jgi:hypothetical protein
MQKLEMGSSVRDSEACLGVRVEHRAYCEVEHHPRKGKTGSVVRKKRDS